MRPDVRQTENSQKVVMREVQEKPGGLFKMLAKLALCSLHTFPQ